MSPNSEASGRRTAACHAILGGTFDPVHCGHLHAAHVGRDALGAASVTLLPAGRPWHRPPPQASGDHRWRMLGLALRDEPGLTRSDLEIVRAGPSYTVDTLGLLAGDVPLVWFIGVDALAAIASWHRADELAALCHLLVFNRPGAGACGQPPPGYVRAESAEELTRHDSGRIHYLLSPMRDISASAVRRRIAAGGDPGGWLPAPVWAYIKAQRLYAGLFHADDIGRGTAAKDVSGMAERGV